MNEQQIKGIMDAMGCSRQEAIDIIEANAKKAQGHEVKQPKMSVEELQNRITELGKKDADKITKTDFNDILAGLGDYAAMAKHALDHGVKAKAMEDLAAKVQAILERTPQKGAHQQQKEMTDDEKIARAFGSAFRAQKFGSAEDAMMFKQYGGRIATDDKNADWKDSKWDLMASEELIKHAGDIKAALGSSYLRGDAVTGSYVVPTLFDSNVFAIQNQTSQMLALMREFPMTNRKYTLNSRATGVTLGWRTNEATAIGEGSPTFDEFDLEAETCALYIGYTEDLDEDSEIALVPYWQGLLTEAWGTEADKQALVASADPFTGVLYDTGVTDVVMDSGETSFSDVTWADLVTLKRTVPTSKRSSGMFFLHSDVLGYFEKEVDANGRPIWKEPSDGMPGTLAGRPYREVDVMPQESDSGASKPFIAYGDPKDILYGNRIGTEFMIFDMTQYRLTQGQIFLRFRTRKAFKNALPAGWARLKTAAS